MIEGSGFQVLLTNRIWLHSFLQTALSAAEAKFSAPSTRSAWCRRASLALRTLVAYLVVVFLLSRMWRTARRASFPPYVLDDDEGRAEPPKPVVSEVSSSRPSACSTSRRVAPPVLMRPGAACRGAPDPLRMCLTSRYPRDVRCSGTSYESRPTTARSTSET